MSKNLVKKIAVACLAAFITIPNIASLNNVHASIINGEEYGSSEPEAPITVVSTNGNLTNFKDALGDIYTAYTTEVNEYITLQNQGLTKIKTFTTTTQGDNMDNHFITEYFLSGYQKVKLPDTALIRVNDKYTLELLSLEKYLQGTQKTTDDYYLMKEEAKKKGQETLENSRKQQAEAKADQQQIDLNNQINAELNVYSENKAGQKTALKYSKDYLENYSKTNLQKSNDKIWASFDNERNYIQQWLKTNGFKNLKELENIRYNWKTKEDEEKSAKYSSQSKAAQQYYKDIESGVLPKNCSMGDWIRYNLKKNPMGGWNGLAQWSTNIDFGLVPDASNTKWVTYKDSYNNNVEIKKMIEENLPIIASYANLTKAQKTQTVESLISGTFISPMGEKNSGIKIAAEFRQEILNKWNTEYLPNIKE